MKLELVLKDGSRQLFDLPVQGNIVNCGGAFLAGVVEAPCPEAFSFAMNCACYAINEGKVLAEAWLNDEESPREVMDFAFAITQISRLELSAMGFNEADLPERMTRDGALFYRQDTNQVVAALFLAQVGKMDLEALDAWYEKFVGYRMSEDDPSAKTDLGYYRRCVAEMMCLHQFGEGDFHTALLAQFPKS